MGKHYSAAMIVIGNEILSGRTQDKNINYVANKLVEHGVSLKEVRIIPDVEDIIIETIKTLKAQYDYIFTSGGIGPTHDDITAECIAKACDTTLELNQGAYDVLLTHYGSKEELTEPRLKMAHIPIGGTMIPNPVSAAPGFIIENIYVMAGVPRIMQAMMDHIVLGLEGGAVIESRTVPCPYAESKVAQGLGDIQNHYPQVDIGSYPHFQGGNLGVSVVLRSSDLVLLQKAEEEVKALIAAIG